MEKDHSISYDVIIVGAGVVGSALTTVLAKEHHRKVAVIGNRTV
jgi:L-2-hydroxyglutarate oxidase LhgO